MLTCDVLTCDVLYNVIATQTTDKPISEHVRTSTSLVRAHIARQHIARSHVARSHIARPHVSTSHVSTPHLAHPDVARFLHFLTTRMRPMLIGWQLEPFRCEFRGETGGGWLQVFNGDELVRREPVSSLALAYQRARELCDQLLWKHSKGA